MRNKYSRREENTKYLLQLIANHLSSRECCRKKEYQLEISDKYPSGYSFDMEVYVFPDRYHRKESDKDAVVRHILQNHMTHICDENYSMLLDTVIPGVYIYKLSVDEKRRKWIISNNR